MATERRDKGEAASPPNALDSFIKVCVEAWRSPMKTYFLYSFAAHVIVVAVLSIGAIPEGIDWTKEHLLGMAPVEEAGTEGKEGATDGGGKGAGKPDTKKPGNGKNSGPPKSPGLNPKDPADPADTSLDDLLKASE